MDNPVLFIDPDGMRTAGVKSTYEKTNASDLAFTASGVNPDEDEHDARVKTANQYAQNLQQIGKSEDPPRRKGSQRESNRGRLSSGGVLFDARGEELFSHWINGSGKDLILTSENWQNYA